MGINHREYIKSKEWAEIRIEIIVSRKCCERCGSKKKLNVHHLDYSRLGNEEPGDLELLCWACHANEHGKLPKKKIGKIGNQQRIRKEMRKSRNYQKRAMKYC